MYWCHPFANLFFFFCIITKIEGNTNYVSRLEALSTVPDVTSQKNIPLSTTTRPFAQETESGQRKRRIRSQCCFCRKHCPWQSTENTIFSGINHKGKTDKFKDIRPYIRTTENPSMAQALQQQPYIYYSETRAVVIVVQLLNCVQQFVDPRTEAY